MSKDINSERRRLVKEISQMHNIEQKEIQTTPLKLNEFYGLASCLHYISKCNFV